jgi:hypothetical protein
MDLTQFELERRLVVLDYLTEHKGKGLNFVRMEVDAHEASLSLSLTKILIFV